MLSGKLERNFLKCALLVHVTGALTPSVHLTVATKDASLPIELVDKYCFKINLMEG